MHESMDACLLKAFFMFIHCIDFPVLLHKFLKLNVLTFTSDLRVRLLLTCLYFAQVPNPVQRNLLRLRETQNALQLCFFLVLLLLVFLPTVSGNVNRYA